MPAEGTAALADSLRVARGRAALLVALADLGGAWGLAEVTGALTALADRAVQLGLTALVAEEIARGKLPGVTEADIPEAAGMFVLAMGKMGARRAQLLLRHRPHRPLRRDPPRPRRLRRRSARASSASPSAW